MSTLVFDIGKTNKKYFIFDENFNLINHHESVFPETCDDDGYPCDNIDLITQWLIDSYNFVASKFKISFINFSTYGASFVHLDKSGLPVTPLYNYLKPLPNHVADHFFSYFKDKESFSIETSSPYLGMLNSGVQLFWLMNDKKPTYSKIKISLHLPQYCSFIFTKQFVSEYTSIGCHTGLWDFSKRKYHNWVKKCGIQHKLSPVVNSNHYYTIKGIRIGVGIHDSSAALLPYLYGSIERFILISTGTWSICLNPFNKEKLTKRELENDCLSFMQPNGNPVKASRLFLGHEHEKQLIEINNYFDKNSGYFLKIKFDEKLYYTLLRENLKAFYFESWESHDKRNIKINHFKSFKEAYHQLILELVHSQVKSLKLVIGKSDKINTIFIDGGFSKNELFYKMIAIKLPDYRIKITELAGGSALGAAIILNREKFNPEVFNRILKVKEINI